MDGNVKKELMYVGLLTLVGIIIVFILSVTLPLRPNQTALDMNKTPEQIVQDNCVNLCKENIDSLKNVENGPCLSDLFKFDSNEYVCDIVNDPKKEIDSLPLNQCQEYLNGTKTKFIEVNSKCEIVKDQ